MSKYTHEFCQKVLTAFEDRYKAQESIEDIKDELNEKYRAGRFSLSLGKLFGGDICERFKKYLDEIDADTQLREILLDEKTGWPVSNSDLEAHFLRLKVNSLEARVEQLEEGEHS